MVNWIVATALAAAICIILRGRVHYSILYTLLAGLFLSRYIPKYIMRNLDIKRVTEISKLFVGESTYLELTIQNKSILPIPWLVIRQNLPFCLSESDISYVVSLGAKSKEIIRVKLEATERGLYLLGHLYWTLGDLLGLSDLSGDAVFGDYILVYPKIYPLEGYPLRSKVFLGETKAKERYYEDPAKLMGIRDYHPGDSPRRIHWKASARFASIKVKEFDPTVTSIYHIMLNINEDDYKYGSIFNSDIETAIEFAASLTYRLHTEKVQVGLTTNGRDGLKEVIEDAEPLNSPGQAVRLSAGSLRHTGVLGIMELLARAKASSGSSFVEMLLGQLGAIPRGAIILVITPKATEEFQRAIATLRKQGYRVIVFLMGRPKKEQLEQIFIGDVPAYCVDKVGKGQVLYIKPVTVGVVIA